ncbi:hypothetical protein DRE_07293 [Drechslerella stenobrocha 248]|uniref:Uncharacterized protein n=1 Tax=Drechslerella stenobrocha 248 TaxID=1043628 RepID=W7HLA8_9PEZI|nr:hypothetical protein DRE_07293 [Drechslerella stenobrocha 248]
MGLFSKIKDGRKNRHSIQQPPPPPPGPSAAKPTSDAPQNHSHGSTPSLIPPQDSPSTTPISPQPTSSQQQPPWGLSSSPNPHAQGQFWPQQGQFGFPPAPSYALQGGQLVPIYTGQQVALPAVGSPASSSSDVGYNHNQTSQTSIPAAFSTSPYHVSPLPIPPVAPPPNPLAYHFAAQPPPNPLPNSDYSGPLPVPMVSLLSGIFQIPYSQLEHLTIGTSQGGADASKAAAPATVSTGQSLDSTNVPQPPTAPLDPAQSPIRLSPQMEQKVEFLKGQGNSMVEANNFDQAVMFYSMALDYNPDSAVCLSNRSMAYTKVQPPQMDKARSDAEAATKADPAYWKGWSRLGDVLLNIGEMSQAVDAYQTALVVGGDAVGQNTKKSLAIAMRAVEQNGRTASPATPPLLPNGTPSTRVQSTPPSNPSVALQCEPLVGAAKLVSASAPPALPTTEDALPSRPPPTRVQPAPLDTQPIPTASRGADASASTAAPNAPTSPSGNAPARTGQAATGLPAVLEEAVANVEEIVNSEAPPAYAPNPNSTDPAIRHMSQQAVYAQVIELRNTLLVRNKGSFVIKPYTTVGNIDAVRIEFVGMSTQELTPRELGVHPDQHPSFSGYFVNSMLYPGCTLIDLDMEVSKIGEGRLPGTHSVSGYTEIYRAQQLETTPALPLTFSSVHPLPEVTVDQIISRMTVLKYNRLLPETNMQMYDSLRKFLGPDPYPNQSDADKASLKNQITDICYVLNRVDPLRYVDMSICRHLTNNTLGTAAQGVGLKNFLFQILLGCELLVRLLKEPANSIYVSLISHNISANLVISDLWMQNIDTRRETTPAGLPRHLLISLVHQRQCEGLIRFAETLKWSYMDEARNYIEGAYGDLITGKAIGFDMCDWLFGLVRPGKLYRHLIMNCLVYSSPSIRDYLGAPTFTCGLVLPNQSFWPRRSVLGGVLGGLRNVTSVCGWVGPAPKVEGVAPGWCQVDARKVTIPIPCTKSQRTAEELEESRIGPDGRVMNAEEQITDLADIAQWAVPEFPSRADSENPAVTFKGIRLTLQQDQAATSTLAPLKVYRAVLDFDVSGVPVSYTLYCNPTFVAAHPCVGSHLAHRTETKAIRKTIISVAELKDTYLQYNSLLVIDATAKGDELLARAWCSERGCNAVVWRGDETCFACAALMTMSTNGLGFNVLIRSL